MKCAGPIKMVNLDASVPCYIFALQDACEGKRYRWSDASFACRGLGKNCWQSSLDNLATEVYSKILSAS